MQSELIVLGPSRPSVEPTGPRQSRFEGLGAGLAEAVNGVGALQHRQRHTIIPDSVSRTMISSSLMQ
jgi:hypothetical protein